MDVRPVSSRGGEEAHYLTFRVGGRRFAIALPEIEEVGDVPPITPLPNVPEWICGVMNLHGRVVSCIDMSVRLDVGNGVSGGDSRVVVVRARKLETVAALLVDSIAAIGPLSSSSLVVDGDGAIQVLDVEQVLSVQPDDRGEGLS